MKYLIWLQLCLGAGNKRAVQILKHFETAQSIYGENKEKLKASGLFTATELKRMSQTKLENAEEILKQCKTENINLVAYGSKEYPQLLAEIPKPPILLYVKGKLPNFDLLPTISIVGPRNVSEFGKKAAFSLGYRLAKAGFIVISGGAVGTDSYAHAGVLKAKGTTVLVMGCGIKSSYLEENRAMREQIAKTGCLISEYPPDFPASRFTFPIRNRLIAGLSLGTVIVEAGKKSGALITAALANEQGRDVFVIPNSPDKKESIGSNELLRDGAKPLLNTSDIFNEYIVRFPDKINIERAYEKPAKTENKKNKIAILNENLSKEAKIVYNCLDKQKFYPDELETELESAKLLSALVELEMEFVIRALPGGQYELLK